MQDSYLNHYFDHIYVINLEFKATDRLRVARHLSNRGVNFEFFKAINGHEGKALEDYREYQKREIGDLRRYPEYNEMEKNRGSHFIESAGAIGIIYSFIEILKDAKTRGYKRFLIFEDDILLSNNFEDEFRKFIINVGDDWKMLLLGASQYGWDSIDIKTAEKKGFYRPLKRSGDICTCGAFALALDSTVIDDFIEAANAFESPIDNFPTGELYEKFYGKCFVAYPNIVIADVSDSSVRGKRDQYLHSEKMKWELENFDYPLYKPSISVIITSKKNLKYYSSFSKTKELPFNLRLFFNSSDGLRPLHNVELPNTAENMILPLNNFFIPKSDYLVTIDKYEILTENDIVKFIEYKLNMRKKNNTPLKEMKTNQKKVIKERISVIIPTYKRPEHLKSAMTSVITQDYPDIEVIIVSDNGKDSEYEEETRKIIHSFDGKSINCNILFIEHNVNRNGSAARNTGIMYSTGEYICFLDDDDIYLPGRLAKSIEVLKTTNKSVGAVYCGYLGWNSAENDLGRYQIGDLTLDILLLNYKKHYMHTDTATYKREAILQLNGFDETYRRHQDLEFNLRFFEHYVVEAVKEPLVRLRPEPTDINNMEYNLNLIKIKQKFLNQFSYIIDMYDHSSRSAIYEAHQREAIIFISNKNAFIGTLETSNNNSFIHMLRSNILNDKYRALKDEYSLLMNSVSTLVGTPIKKQPLQKFSAYSSLTDIFIKQQKKVL